MKNEKIKNEIKLSWLSTPLAPIWSILGRCLVDLDPDLNGFRHQQATAKQLQQSTSQKQNHKTAQQQSIPPFMHIICLGLALLVPGWLQGWWGRAKRLELSF